MTALVALVLLAIDPQAADASNALGVGGGVTGLASFGFVVWLVKLHRDERREWREAADREKGRIDAERAKEREECRKDIADLYAQVSDLWKRLTPATRRGGGDE